MLVNSTKTLNKEGKFLSKHIDSYSPVLLMIEAVKGNADFPKFFSHFAHPPSLGVYTAYKSL